MIRAHVLVCGGTGCTSSGSQKIQAAFTESIEKNGLSEEVKLVQTGCFGLCALGPVVIIYPEGTFYSRVTPEDVDEIVTEHLLKGRPVERLVYKDTGDAEEEITEAKNAFNVLGVEVETVKKFDFYGAKRSIAVLKKIKKTPNQYPRGRGKERKNPL